MNKRVMTPHDHTKLYYLSISFSAGVIRTHKNLPVSQNQTTSTKPNLKPTLNPTLTLTLTLNPTLTPDPSPTLTPEPNPNPNNNNNLIK